MGASEEVLPVFESFYLDVLEVLENHFITTHYLFGGMPSIADFALMGPLFGHLARDPEPARIMKQLAHRVFRWTEVMNTPNIQSPEFADFEMVFDSGDQLSEGASSLLRLCLEYAGQLTPRTADIYSERIMDKLN